MNTYYHVVNENYEAGDPLLCLDKLRELGFDIDWKWEDAGWDTDVVCVFENLEDAQEFKADFGGKILKINVSQEDIDDPIGWMTKYGYIHPELTTVIEGYKAFTDGVPAEWIDECLD